jgi:hypothetical protein
MISILLYLFSGIISKQKTVNVSNFKKNDTTEHLIISFFLPSIGEALDDYYSEYISNGVKLFPYYVDIINIQKLPLGATSIKFGVTPQIGSHNPVGYDEITFHISATGDITLDTYEHKKTYTLPEGLEDIFIKPLPD